VREREGWAGEQVSRQAYLRFVRFGRDRGRQRYRDIETNIIETELTIKIPRAKQSRVAQLVINKD
jgi:hypothetical protein